MTWPLVVRRMLIRRGVFRAVACCAALGAWVQHAAADEVPAEATHFEDDLQIEDLVNQLGAAEFRAREAATEKLVRLGPIVIPYMQAATEQPNLELNTRAKRILAIVSRQSFEAEIKAFIADTDGRMGATLPGWERARKRLGDGTEARRLFADMYRAEPAVLEAYGEDSAAATLALRVDQLHDQHIQRNQVNYRVRNQLQQIIATNVLACLFVGADEQVEISAMTISRFKMLFIQSWPRERISSAPESEFLRQWLSAWIIHRFGLPHREYEGITLGMQYDVPETVELATRVLERGDNQPYSLLYAVLCVGKYGQAWHLPQLEPRLSDETTVQRRQSRVNNEMVVFETQLRDVALLVLLHRTGQDAREYGFAEVSGNAEYLFLPHTIYFEKADARTEAFTKYAAWRQGHSLFAGEPPAPIELTIAPPSSDPEQSPPQGEEEPPRPS